MPAKETSHILCENNLLYIFFDFTELLTSLDLFANQAAKPEFSHMLCLCSKPDIVFMVKISYINCTFFYRLSIIAWGKILSTYMATHEHSVFI